MQIAFYRASEGNIADKAINLWTGGKGFSHVELVFSNGLCFSSSQRDGGCRFKKILLKPEKWFIVNWPVSEEEEEEIKDLCRSQIGKDYDWAGILFWFVFPFKGQSDRRWWCSEVCSWALGWEKYRIHPNKMLKEAIKRAKKLQGDLDKSLV
jgi:hypothetical protein